MHARRAVSECSNALFSVKQRQLAEIARWSSSTAMPDVDALYSVALSRSRLNRQPFVSIYDCYCGMAIALAT
jgi:hypothetical protein